MWPVEPTEPFPANSQYLIHSSLYEITVPAKTRAYVEHVAVRVKDIQWHIHFFREALGMDMREVDGDPASPNQYWTIGGLQFIGDPTFEAPPSNEVGWLAHLGIMVEDLDAAIAACKSLGAVELPKGKGPNWLQLPDGLAIELLQATGNSVEEVLAIDPRAESPQAEGEVASNSTNPATPGSTTASPSSLDSSRSSRREDEVITPAAVGHSGKAYVVPPATDFSTPERTWDDASDGDVCISPTYLVTEERINLYAELTGDYTPVHIDEDYAKTTPFGTRVAHGLFGLSIADGLKTRSEYRFLPGMSLGWTWDFKLPIKINDELRVKFTVSGMRPSKSRPEWGIVVLESELLNQQDQVVQKGEHRLMIPRRTK